MSRETILQIRNKFHSTIRKQQLQEIFAKKRAQFSQINFRENTPMDIINDLIHQIMEYPNDNNIYVNIGNYLIDHYDHSIYFQSYLLPFNNHFCQNQAWVLTIMILTSKLACQDNFDVSIAKMLEDNRPIVIYYGLTCLNHLLNTLDEFSKKNRKSIKQFQQLIDKQDQIRKTPYFNQILSIMHDILNNLANQSQKLSAKSLQKMMKCLLINLIQSRQQNLKLFKKIAINFKYEQLGILFNQDILKEFIYLFNVAQIDIKILIFQILQILLSQFTIFQITILLNLEINASIVDGLSQQEIILQKTLKIVKLLFTRLQQANQKQLLKKVFYDLDNRRFPQKIQQLLYKKHSKQIENLLAHIVDNYYSQEVK